MEWYRIVCTSHVAQQAVKEVERAYAEFSPDVVAVELDPDRLHALLVQEKERPSFFYLLKTVGLTGALFATLGGAAQRKLGRMVGMDPGAEMLAAFRLAQRDGKRVLLVDRDLRVTLRRLKFGWREFRQLLKDLWRGLLGKDRLSFDLDKVPSEAVVGKLLAEFRARYPRPYAALVEERNKHMVRSLLSYHETHITERVLVVVGAGHVAGMRGLLEA